MKLEGFLPDCNSLVALHNTKAACGGEMVKKSEAKGRLAEAVS